MAPVVVGSAAAGAVAVCAELSVGAALATAGVSGAAGAMALIGLAAALAEASAGVAAGVAGAGVAAVSVGVVPVATAGSAGATARSAVGVVVSPVPWRRCMTRLSVMKEMATRLAAIRMGRR